MQANTSLELQLERTAERLWPHVAQAGHGALTALLGVCNRALAETARLQALPPPPPVGADVQDEQRSQIEDLRAVEEVHRRQLGALVHEKGCLNAEVRQLRARLEEMREEKAEVAVALGEALRSTSDERANRDGEGALMQEMAPVPPLVSSTPASLPSSSSCRLPLGLLPLSSAPPPRPPSSSLSPAPPPSLRPRQMVASQKRTIEALRRQLRDARPPPEQRSSNGGTAAAPAPAPASFASSAAVTAAAGGAAAASASAAAQSARGSEGGGAASPAKARQAGRAGGAQQQQQQQQQQQRR